MPRRNDGTTKSIQIDIPEQAHMFIKQQIEERKALTGDESKLADIVREALGSYFHVPADFFDVRRGKKGQGES